MEPILPALFLIHGSANLHNVEEDIAVSSDKVFCISYVTDGHNAGDAQRLQKRRVAAVDDLVS